ncbi:MAG: hypothetical protein H7Y22_19360 [Gemmatimonadaceae bacterium]|nr:hypothetical protein [Gloeobacterales cyanobacterium ES-bin-141]
MSDPRSNKSSVSKSSPRGRHLHKDRQLEWQVGNIRRWRLAGDSWNLIATRLRSELQISISESQLRKVFGERDKIWKEQTAPPRVTPCTQPGPAANLTETELCGGDGFSTIADELQHRKKELQQAQKHIKRLVEKQQKLEQQKKSQTHYEFQYRGVSMLYRNLKDTYQDQLKHREDIEASKLALEEASHQQIQSLQGQVRLYAERLIQIAFKLEQEARESLPCPRSALHIEIGALCGGLLDYKDLSEQEVILASEEVEECRRLLRTGS